jgi:DNA-binding winged helix-turn-helix (wHTH) protein
MGQVFSNPMRERFGDCIFDSDTRELIRADRSVHISPKGLALLELLLDRRPRAVSKEEIQKRLWPDAVVLEANLTNLVTEVRAAIGDSARTSAWIRTVHGFGYAFSGEATRDRPRSAANVGTPSYRLMCGEGKFLVAEGANVLGRDPEADVFIDNTAVSRRHARISITAGRVKLEDLESHNGTFVNGLKVTTSPVEISDGDVITLGPVTMIFRILAPQGSTETLGPES